MRIIFDPIAGKEFNLKSAFERGSIAQTVDEMDIVDRVDCTWKVIGFRVHFVHKVHRLERRISKEVKTGIFAVLWLCFTVILDGNDCTSSTRRSPILGCDAGISLDTGVFRSAYGRSGRQPIEIGLIHGKPFFNVRIGQFGTG